MSIPLTLSLLSLGVAIIGTALSYKRSGQALEQSRKAATTALWADALGALQRLVGMDPLEEPMQEKFANVRVSITALIDDLEWEGFDRWVAAEHQLGASLARGAMESGSPNDTADERFKKLEPFMEWATILSTNLRFARKSGSRPAEFKKLQEAASANMAKLYKQRGWGTPPG